MLHGTNRLASGPGALVQNPACPFNPVSHPSCSQLKCSKKMWKTKCTKFVLRAPFLGLCWELGTPQNQARVTFCEGKGYWKRMIPPLLVLSPRKYNLLQTRLSLGEMPGCCWGRVGQQRVAEHRSRADRGCWWVLVGPSDSPPQSGWLCVAEQVFNIHFQSQGFLIYHVGSRFIP